MAIVIVILLLVLASILFHFFSPWWFTPIASNWTSIDTTIDITLWITGVVFILVNVFLAYAIYRFRYQKHRKADYEPENKKLEIVLTIVTTIGVAAMLAPGLIVWNEFVHVPEDAKEFEVVGQQWSWNFRFPGKDGVLGKIDSRLINASNPFGMSPNDPFGQDDVLVNSNELHLPVDQSVKVLQRSKDVLHNFAIPQFRVKMDLVPGLTSYFWFTPTKIGRYEILCQELCGIAHYLMRGNIVIETEPEYQLWLASYPTYADTLMKPQADLVAGKNLFAACIACHGEQGLGNEAMNAPKIAGMNSWYTQRQLNYFKDKVRGSAPADLFGTQMAAMVATLPDKQAIENVAAYIESLAQGTQGASGRSAISGNSNPNNGKSLYRNCSFCHGSNGEGNYALNAPKLAGQHQWYLKRQLLNFKNDLRGNHQQDLYGKQMILMARLLQDEQAIDDVTAYISQLSVTNSQNSQRLLQE